MAAEAWPGKGKAKPGVYTMPSGEERYYGGGDSFYRERPGGGRQVIGEILQGSGYRGMSQFDNPASGENRGGVAPQNANPFAPNFQPFYSPRFDEGRKPYKHNPNYTNNEVRDNKASVDAMWEKMKKEQAAKEPPVEENPTGRDSDRTNPLGVQQKGTQMGPKPMSIGDVNSALGRIGSNQITNPFASNNLPTTTDYKVPNTEGETPTQTAPGVPSAVSNAVSGVKSKVGSAVGAAVQKNGGFAEVSPEMEQVQAGGEVNTGLTPTDTSGLKYDASKYNPEPNSGGAYAPPTVIDAAEIQRRRSFLDADNSMQGLRNIEADQGIYVAGGKYHHVNPNAGKEGQNDFMEISKGDRDTIMRGGDGAQQLRDSYVSRITDKGDEKADAPAPEAATPYAPTQAEGVNSNIQLEGNDMGEFQADPGYQSAKETYNTDGNAIDLNDDPEYSKLRDSVRNNFYLPK